MIGVDEFAMVEFCRLSGITTRQLNYWTGCGWLRLVDRSRGSGYPRCWSADELAVARRMKTMTTIGLGPRIASELARHMVESGTERARRVLDMGSFSAHPFSWPVTCLPRQVPVSS